MLWCGKVGVIMVWEVNPGRWLTFAGRCAGRENTVAVGKALPDLSDPYEEVQPHRRRRPTVEVHRLPVLNHRVAPTLAG